jgi:hypothetical protein
MNQNNFNQTEDAFVKNLDNLTNNPNQDETLTLDKNLTVTPPVNPVNPTEVTPTNIEPSKDITKNTQEDVNKDKNQTPPKEPDKSNPLRELREQYNREKEENTKQKAILQRIADQRGISIEELQAKLDEEEDKKLAQEKQIPLETQKQLREYQQRLEFLEKERIKENFNFRASKLLQEFPELNTQTLSDFFQKATSVGFDLTNPNLDMGVIYRAMNLDSILSKVKEDVRQTVLNELQAQKTQSPVINSNRIVPPGTNPSKSPNITEQEFMSEVFNKLIKK